MSIGSDGMVPSTSAGPSSVSLADELFAKPELPKELTLQEYLEQEEIYRLRKVTDTVLTTFLKYAFKKVWKIHNFKYFRFFILVKLRLTFEFS